MFEAGQQRPLITKITFGVLGHLLIAAYLAILLFACYCRVVEGHWPSYNNPDRSNLPVPLIGYTVALIVVAAATSVVIYPLFVGTVALFQRIKKGRADRIGRWHVSAFIAGVLLWVLDFSLLHVMEPRSGGLLNWFFD